MRNLIKGPVALGLLDEIEAKLGYTIPVIYTPPGKRPSERTYSMGKNAEGWSLIIAEGLIINDRVLVHELLHIQLIVEGWPSLSFAAPESTPDYSALLDCYKWINSLIAHIEVWPRSIALGFNITPHESRQYEEGTIQPLEAGRPPEYYYPPNLHTGRLALDLASVLLSRCRKDTKKHLLKLQGKDRVLDSAFHIAFQIETLFGTPPKITSDEYLEKFQAIARLVGAPQLNQFVTPDNN